VLVKHNSIREGYIMKNKNLIEYSFEIANAMYYQVQKELPNCTFDIYNYTIDSLSDFILYKNRKPTNKQIMMFMKGMTEAYRFNIKDKELNIIPLMLKLCEIDYKLDNYTYKIRLYNQVKEYNKDLIYMFFKYIQMHLNKSHNIIPELLNDLVTTLINNQRREKGNK